MRLNKKSRLRKSQPGFFIYGRFFLPLNPQRPKQRLQKTLGAFSDCLWLYQCPTHSSYKYRTYIVHIFKLCLDFIPILLQTKNIHKNVDFG